MSLQIKTHQREEIVYQAEYQAGWRLVLSATKYWDEAHPGAYLRTAQIIEPLALTGDPFARGIWDACRSLSGVSPV
jgi:hypothetical protein